MDMELLEESNGVETFLPWVIGLVSVTLLVYACATFDIGSVMGQTGMHIDEISTKITEIWSKFNIMYALVHNIESKVIDLNFRLTALTYKKPSSVSSDSDITDSDINQIDIEL